MLGCSLDMIRCVLVTHDHLDHIRHLGSFCKHLKVPVYATETLHRALASHLFTRDWIGPYRHILKEGVAEPACMIPWRIILRSTVSRSLTMPRRL